MRLSPSPDSGNIADREQFRQICLLALILCVLLAPAAPIYAQSPIPETTRPEQPEQGRRVALVIGNSGYRALSSLPNPINDAQDLCNALRKLNFEVTCLVDVRTRREFRDEIRRLTSQLTSRDAALFYYAGHGIQYRGENYLIPVDAEIRAEADVDFEGIGLSYLMQDLEAAHSAPNIIILDACRDNPFAGPPRVTVQKGLARIDPPPGTMLVYSTAPNRGAIDGHGRNGLFTKHLLANLARPGLTLDELFRVVAEGVTREAQSVYRIEQVPYRNSSYSAPYCLAGCDDPQLAERIRAIERHRDALNERLCQLELENSDLRHQAERGSSMIVDLEARIAQLTREISQRGQSGEEARVQLKQAEAELMRIRQSQQERELREQENLRRRAELEELRAELQRQISQGEEYRRKIQQLEKEREQAWTERDVKERSGKKPASRPEIIVPSF